MTQETTCPVCHSSRIYTFLNREQVPVHQNLVMVDRKAAKEIAKGDLLLTVCQKCGFIFNQSFEPSKLSYGEYYDNTQSYSLSFETYLSQLIHYLAFEKNVKNCNVVEVGCGKGHFLRKLIEVEEWGNRGYGFDPSYVGSETDFRGRLKFKKRYYNLECADILADVVICRHVIEHVPEPLELLRTVRQALINSPQSRVFFETPCVEWILRNQVIWDFFYEHCSYFTAQSLRTVFEVSGFNVESVEHIFNGQYLWLEATISDRKPIILKDSAFIGILVEQFSASEEALVKEWKNKVKNLAMQGKVALWGAGAKGVTFANLIDPEQKWIDCIIDINPNKQGKYIPGTGHSIVSYQEIENRKITSAILMNPNYYDENLALLKEANLDVNLVV